MVKNILIFLKFLSHELIFTRFTLNKLIYLDRHTIKTIFSMALQLKKQQQPTVVIYYDAQTMQRLLDTLGIIFLMCYLCSGTFQQRERFSSGQFYLMDAHIYVYT